MDRCNDDDQTRQGLNDKFDREFDRFCSSDARIKVYECVAETLPFWSTLTDEQKEILITTNDQTLRTPLGWKFKGGKFVTESQKKGFLEEKKKLESLVRQGFLNSIDLDLKEALEKYKFSSDLEEKMPERKDWVHEYFQREHLGQEETSMKGDKVAEGNSQKDDVQEKITAPLNFHCNEFAVSRCSNHDVKLTPDNGDGCAGGPSNNKLTGSSEEIDKQPSYPVSPSADLNQPEDMDTVNTPSPGISSRGPNENLEVQENGSVSAPISATSGIISPGPNKTSETQENIREDCSSSASSSLQENSTQQESKRILMNTASSPSSSTSDTNSPGHSKNLGSPDDVSEDCSTSPLVPCVLSPIPERNHCSNFSGLIEEKDYSLPPGQNLSEAIGSLPSISSPSSNDCLLGSATSEKVLPQHRIQNQCETGIERTTSSSNPLEVTLVKSPNRVASPQNTNKRGRPRIQVGEPTTVRCEVDENLEEEELDEIIISPTKDQMSNSSRTLKPNFLASTTTNSNPNSSGTLETDFLDEDSVVDENLEDSDVDEIEISFSPICSSRAVSNENDSGVFDGISVGGCSLEDGLPDSVPSAVEICSEDPIELDVQIEDGTQTRNDYEPGNLDLPSCQSDVHENSLFPSPTVENEGEVLNQKIDCSKDFVSSEVHKASSNCNMCGGYDSGSLNDFGNDEMVALPNAFVREELSEFLDLGAGRILMKKSPEEPYTIPFSRVHLPNRFKGSRIFHSSKGRLPTGFKFKQLDDTAQNIQTTPTGPYPSTPDEWHIESQAKDIRRFLEGLETRNMDTLRAIDGGNDRKKNSLKLLKTVLNEDFAKEDFSKYAKVYEQEMEIIPFLFLENWEKSQSEQLAVERSIVPIQLRHSLERMRRQELDEIWTEQFTKYRTQYDLDHFKISMNSNAFRSYVGPWEAGRVAFVANFQGYIERILRFHFREISNTEIEYLVEEFSKAKTNLKQNLKKELIEQKWMPKISQNEGKLLRMAYYRNWNSLEGFKIATMSVETCSATIKHNFNSQRNGSREWESFEVFLQNLVKRNPKLIKVLPWVIRDPPAETSKRLQPHRAAKTWTDKELPDITEYPPTKIIGNGVNYEDSGGIPLFGGVLGGDKEQKKEDSGREVSTFKFAHYPKNWVHDPNSEIDEIPLEGVLAEVTRRAIKREALEVSKDKQPAKKKSRSARKKVTPARKNKGRGRPRGRPTKKR
ncbi:hypothetical protein L3Y34_003377 [Caenorhabditis briggsae]|uniref:Uncharacterized protein n=1 Tax=Caenorhabditis briggsae TaxID=6238 RepID=A0AAE9AFC3_CAEBR|nr:hypothetical protein L3Y34_003377 [Caenorhabditis briggsae]